MMDLRYNEYYPDGQDNAIVANILAEYDSELNGEPQDDATWNQQSIQNYTQFLTAIAKTGLGRSERQMGAYWVDARQDG